MDGYPAELTRAITSENPRSLERIVRRRGAGVLNTPRKHDGLTALTIALEQPHPSHAVIEACLRLGADPCASAVVTRRGLPVVLTPLEHALETRRPELGDLLIFAELRRGTEPGRRDLLLAIAARRGMERAVEVLLAHGARADERNSHRPLNTAAGHGHAGVVRQLLDAGAQPLTADPAQRSPLFTAIDADQGDAARVLIEHVPPGETSRSQLSAALILAARRGEPAIVAALLTHGADPGYTDTYGRTPLHIAAALGHIGAVRALIAHGADPLARSETGDTPRETIIDVVRPPEIDEMLRAAEARTRLRPAGAPTPEPETGPSL